jgi:uncharacterized protein (TIGR03382 family)
MRLVCAVVVLLASGAAAAETYSVAPAPSGSDSATGLPGAPWATLQHAADQVGPGDLVVVSAGTYAGFNLTTGGSSGAPIVFRAESGAVVNSDNADTPDGINVENAPWVTIDGFTVAGVTRAGIRCALSEHVTIVGNTAIDNGRWGIFTGFCNDLLVENNDCSGSIDEHGVYVSNSADRPVVRGNILWSNNANGLHMNGDESMGGDGVIEDALVEGNVIFDNGTGGGSGINCDGCQRAVIRNNLLYGNHASGISLYDIDAAEGSKDNLIVNNTIVQASDGRWAVNIQHASIRNTVVNNVLLTDHSFRGCIDIATDSLSGFVSDYNVVMDRFTTDGGNSVLTLAEWRTATGQGAHSLVANAAEVFVGGGDYHLATHSPAKNAGTATGAPGTDLEGQTRPLEGVVDIGAYEYCPPPCVEPDGGSTADGAPDDDGAPVADGAPVDDDGGNGGDAVAAGDERAPGDPGGSGSVEGGCSCSGTAGVAWSGLALAWFGRRRRCRLRRIDP